MAIPGQIVTGAQRAGMLRQIGATFRHAADEASKYSDRQLERLATREFELATLTREQADDLQTRVAGAAVQIDEGNCFNRALLGAHLAGRVVGAGTAPADDVLGGALAVRAYTHDGGTYTGAFHTKLAVRVEGERELQLIDPLPGNPTFQSLSDWDDPANLRLLRPYEGTGIPFSDGGTRATYVNREGLEFASRMLRASVHAAIPPHGGRVIEPTPEQLAAAQLRAR